MIKGKEEITEYDENDTTAFIDVKKPLKLSGLGFKLPKDTPTKVVSIRLPTKLYNKIKAFSTDMDIPYQAYIKYILNEGIEKDLKSKRKASSGRQARMKKELANP